MKNKSQIHEWRHSSGCRVLQLQQSFQQSLLRHPSIQAGMSWHRWVGKKLAGSSGWMSQGLQSTRKPVTSSSRVYSETCPVQYLYQGPVRGDGCTFHKFANKTEELIMPKGTPLPVKGPSQQGTWWDSQSRKAKSHTWDGIASCKTTGYDFSTAAPQSGNEPGSPGERKEVKKEPAGSRQQQRPTAAWAASTEAWSGDEGAVTTLTSALQVGHISDANPSTTGRFKNERVQQWCTNIQGLEHLPYEEVGGNWACLVWRRGSLGGPDNSFWIPMRRLLIRQSQATFTKV